MIHHRGAYLNALGETVETGMTFDATYLWTLPMFHCNGWCYTWGVTALGGTHVCLRRVESSRDLGPHRPRGDHPLLRGARRCRSASSTMPRRIALARPVTAGVAGAPPSPTLLARMRALGFRPVHVYGLTETYGPHTVCAWHAEWDAMPADEQARLASRQGQGFVMADLVRVVDGDMNDVAMDGETLGEVVMRGNNVMKGYFEQADATAEAFRGGWFHSGDIGVWHPDGYVELRDRKKDIIISGGENISTIEVEQCVARHPAVLECAVVAMPDEKWGERPKAFVTLKPGSARDGGRHHRALPRAHGALQGPGGRGVLRAAQDVHREGAEVRAARPGVEGPGQAHQLSEIGGSEPPLPPMPPTGFEQEDGAGQARARPR